jgi:hypothetical protein
MVDLADSVPGSVAASPDEVVGVTKPAIITASVQIVAAGVIVVLLFLEWVRVGKVGLDGNGGGGFGVLALITALVALYVAVQTLRGRRVERSLLGPSQLASMLAIALFTSNLVFLWVFRTGGAPKWIYVVANVLIYVSVVGLFAPKAVLPEPLGDAGVRRIGAATALLGLVIALAPALPYTELGSRTLTGYEPGAPRIGVLLLIMGGITVFIGLQRALRGSSYADLGPYVLWPHVTIGLGVICTAPAFSWLISGWWGNDFNPGVGVYVSFVLGVGLTALGFFEAAKRGVRGI